MLLIGQDRAGKTSLKRSLIGLPFNPKENSTVGIEVDPSIFQVDVNEVKNWQPVDGNKQAFLGCSKDVAQLLVEKLCIKDSCRNWLREVKEGPEKRGRGHVKDDDLENGDTDDGGEEDLFVNQVCLQS